MILGDIAGIAGRFRSAEGRLHKRHSVVAELSQHDIILLDGVRFVLESLIEQGKIDLDNQGYLADLTARIKQALATTTGDTKP